jgi:hypothetical protein
MRLKEKFYRRFCAPEVRMLLDHMEENFGDFVDDYLNRKMWVRLMEAQDYSKTERKVIKMAYERLKRDHARQQLLGKIIAQKLNPEVPQSPQGLTAQGLTAQGLTAMKASQHQQLVAHQQYASQYNQGAVGLYTDPRAIYGRTP